MGWWQWTSTTLLVLSGYLVKKRKVKVEHQVSNKASIGEWAVIWESVCVAAQYHRKRYHSFPTRQPYLQKVIQCCQLLRQYIQVENPCVLAAYLLRDVLLFQPTAIYALSNMFETELLQLAQTLMHEKSTLDSYLGSLSRQHSGSLSLREKSDYEPVLSRSNSNVSFSSLHNYSLASALDNSWNLSQSGIFTREDDLVQDEDTQSLQEQIERNVSLLSRCIFLSEVLFHLLECKQLLEEGLMVQQSLRYCEYAQQVIGSMRGSNAKLENAIDNLIEYIENRLIGT